MLVRSSGSAPGVVGHGHRVLHAGLLFGRWWEGSGVVGKERGYKTCAASHYARVGPLYSRSSQQLQLASSVLMVLNDRRGKGIALAACSLYACCTVGAVLYTAAVLPLINGASYQLFRNRILRPPSVCTAREATGRLRG
eukprot:scaffold1186_cov399-Prasinococcus_capsulatus_cf.AAC.12